MIPKLAAARRGSGQPAPIVPPERTRKPVAMKWDKENLGGSLNGYLVIVGSRLSSHAKEKKKKTLSS